MAIKRGLSADVLENSGNKENVKTVIGIHGIGCVAKQNMDYREGLKNWNLEEADKI